VDKITMSENWFPTRVGRATVEYWPVTAPGYPDPEKPSAAGWALFLSYWVLLSAWLMLWAVATFLHRRWQRRRMAAGMS
jgi:hypothetical protein